MRKATFLTALVGMSLVSSAGWCGPLSHPWDLSGLCCAGPWGGAYQPYYGYPGMKGYGHHGYGSCGVGCGPVCGRPCGPGPWYPGKCGATCWFPGRNLLRWLIYPWNCDGCGGKPYWSEFAHDPPGCSACDHWGNWVGQPHGYPTHGEPMHGYPVEEGPIYRPNQVPTPANPPQPPEAVPAVPAEEASRKAYHAPHPNYYPAGYRGGAYRAPYNQGYYQGRAQGRSYFPFSGPSNQPTHQGVSYERDAQGKCPYCNKKH